MKQIITLLLLLLPVGLKATPFDVCPSKAFLVQQSVATLSGVNLVSGNTEELTQNMGTNSKVNGFGFSVHDRYLYGWAYEFGTLAKIGKDFQVQPLTVTDLPGQNFFVGDVSAQENTYFAYRKGADYGLYAIALDSSSPNYLQAIRIRDGSSLSLNIFDLAFHPDSQEAYSVDRNGNLIRIDVTDGTSETLGNVGVSGTFGAAYFDVEGTLYISRNSDGHIFRINPNDSEPEAELFAYGPASSNNDGARCATAPVVDEDDTSMDYGDAPASYGTTLADNGARHQIVEGGLFLGSNVDGESIAFQYPASDDETGAQDDEDGVAFLSSLERGQDTLIQVTASNPGYLNVWLDWNQNGRFNSNDQLVSERWVDRGNNLMLISIPNGAQSGETWMRFRLSQESSVGPLGGTVDGEVEDYPVTITDQGIYPDYYPSANSWMTVAYEDNWPELGDYDTNDVVVSMRITSFRTATAIHQYRIEGKLNAIGASYHNGFAIRLPGVNANQVDAESLYFEIDGEVQPQAMLEAGRQEAILIIANDVWNMAESGENCAYFRTEAGCGQKAKTPFKVVVNLIEPLDVALAPAPPFDPFIFATPGTYHGELLGQPGRGWAVHLKNQQPTEAFNTSYLGLAADNANPAAGQYYQTANGLPWALVMSSEWYHPMEYVDLLLAYPDFQSFVESSGADNINWYHPSKRVSAQTINQ